MTEIPQHASSQNDSSDNPHFSSQPPIDMARMEALLAQGTISEQQGVMRWGSNYAALITITGADTDVTAVYKPQRGERPLWDFPDGTLCYREVAAYVVSQALEWYIVPPTVLRNGPHGVGSVQLFIEHNPEINYFNLDDSYIGQLQRYAIYDHIINNADRKGGHLLLDSSGKLWGIDHGLSFNTVPKLRTVIWEFAGQTISDELLQSVEHLFRTLSSHTTGPGTTLRKLLGATENDALFRRIQQLLECKQFPQPGPGPNYPWPPV